eukprot:s1132_g25.t1
MSSSAQPSPAVQVPAPFEAPIAPDEQAEADDVAAGPDEIVLDGTRIDSSSSLAVLKAACGLPSWQRGVWLGKTQNNDAHIVSCNGGLFITRSVRRIPVPWVLAELGNVELTAWECSFATLGSRLMVPKRVLNPAPQSVPALPPAVVQPAQSKLSGYYDEEAEAVKNLPPTPMEQGQSHQR